MVCSPLKSASSMIDNPLRYRCGYERFLREGTHGFYGARERGPLSEESLSRPPLVLKDVLSF